MGSCRFGSFMIAGSPGHVFPASSTERRGFFTSSSNLKILGKNTEWLLLGHMPDLWANRHSPGDEVLWLWEGF